MNSYTQLCHAVHLDDSPDQSDTKSADKRWAWLVGAFEIYSILSEGEIEDAKERLRDRLCELPPTSLDALESDDVSELLELAKQYMKEGRGGAGVLLERTKDGDRDLAVITSNESAELEIVAYILCMYVSRFNAMWQELHWCRTSSKPVVGGYTGGRCIILGHEICWLENIGKEVVLEQNSLSEWVDG